MTKFIPSILACLCAATFLTVGVPGTAQASSSRLDPVRVWGPVTKTEAGGEDIKLLFLNNQSGLSFTGELQITVSNVYTRVLDATTGMPFPYENIRTGDTAYVYIGPALPSSLTPMANASLALCNIPAGYRVPEYLTVESLSWNSAKTQASLTATNGNVYTIPSDCQTVPYLSSNIVTIDDLTPGVSCLLWCDENNLSSRIINFSKPGVPIEQLPMDPGWQKINNTWYYYNSDGTMAHGWVTDHDKQYYFDLNSGIMHTGFLTLDGNTYYFTEDGSLLTEPRMFTPDENGALH